MIILGIADGADASAALVVNNELVAAVTEETARRSRHAHGFPSAAVDTVLEVAGLRPRDVDRVVFAGSFTPAAVFRAQPGLRKDPLPSEWARGVQSVLRKSGLYMVDQGAAVGVLESRLRAQGFAHAFVETLEHDKAHATSIYRTQPRDELLMMTFDSPGDGASLSVWVGRHLQIDRHYLQTALSALAMFPSRIARILGVNEEDLEWIATPEAPADLLVRLREELRYEGPGFNRQKIRRGPDPLREYAHRGGELAAAALTVLEEAVSACVSDNIRRYRQGHIGVAGSILQPRLAGVLAGLPEVDTLWVPPMPGDAGLSAGAVLHAAGTATQRLRDPCLGPSWSEDACYRALANASLPREKVEDPEEETARLLADGKVVARFAGPLEFSYHGLGNRNYLLSTESGAAEKLGEMLRMEGPARLGVAMRVDEAGESLPDLDRVQDAARFATVALRPTAAFAAAHPGVVRQDGRVLPQVVHPEDDPSFYRLLGRYRALTGRDALATLTLARPGEAMASSPADAVGAWRDGKADALFVGPYRVVRS